MNSRGQVSWIWGIISGGIGLVILVVLWIFLDNSQHQMRTTAISQGVNLTNLATFESFIAIVPFVGLASFALYVIIVSTMARGGDYIG